MTANDILDVIGDAKNTYVWDAQQVRSGSITERGKIPVKKLWLIAAVVSLALILVGCAVVYVLSLSEMKIGQATRVEPEHYGPNWEVIEETQITYDVLSVQSFSDSPNQRATREWNGYISTYVDSASDIPLEIRDSVPEVYSGYGCLTPQMMKYLDRLVQKYDLKLLGESLGTNQEYATILLDALKLDGLLRQQPYAEVEITSAGVYQNGNYHLGVHIVLDDSFNWPYYVLADLHYSQTGYFDDYTVRVRNLDTVQEWEYALPDGGIALLALDEETALILVEGEKGFFAIDFDAQMGIDRVTTEMMEKIADLFDFSVIPYTPTDAEWRSEKARFYAAEEQQKLEYNAWLEANSTEKQRDSYDEWVRLTFENGGDIASLGYTFYDIDGNGSSELLIGRDGYCESIYWEQDGATQQFANAAENLYVCENGKIVYVLMPGEENYFFAQLEDGKSKGLGSVQHTPGNPEGDYRTSDPERWGVYNYISKDEYDATLSSFVRIPISFIPLTEYPLQEPVTYGSRNAVYNAGFSSYEEMIRIYLTNQKERWSRWAYDIRDLDGDGQEEMIWREDDRYYICTMVDGAVCWYSMLDDGTLTVCENGIVQAVIRYGPENYTVRFYRLNRGNLEIVDYLRYDTDRDPENPWFRSPDLTGQDFSLEAISEMEAKSVIASYDPLEINMKPIAEYPFE